MFSWVSRKKLELLFVYIGMFFCIAMPTRAAIRYGGFLNLGALELRYVPADWQAGSVAAKVLTSPFEINFESFTTYNQLENFTLATTGYFLGDLGGANDAYAWSMQNKLYVHFNTVLSFGTYWTYTRQSVLLDALPVLRDSGHQFGMLIRMRW